MRVNLPSNHVVRKEKSERLVGNIGCFKQNFHVELFVGLPNVCRKD